MDIKSPRQKFGEALERTLQGEAVDDRSLLAEEKELLHLASQLKKSDPAIEPDERFEQNLRKRLVNLHASELSAEAEVTPPLLDSGEDSLLASPKRRFGWAAIPLSVVVLAVAFGAWAAASPGFYENYVPQPIKSALQKAEVVKLGSADISSTPAGATVYLNGRSRGKTPLEISDIREGAHRIKIELTGFETISEDIQIESGQATIRDYQLTATVAEEAAEHVSQTEFQLVMADVSRDQSALYLTSADESNVATLAEFDSAINSPVVTDSGAVYYVYSSAAVLGAKSHPFAIMRLYGGEQIEMAHGQGVATDLQVNSDGSQLVYSSGQGIYKVDTATQKIERIVALAEGETSLQVLAMDDQAVYYLTGQGGFDSKLAKVDLATGTAVEYTLPSEARLSTNLGVAISPDEASALIPQANGALGLFDLETQAFETIFEGDVTKFIWVGSGKVLVNTGVELKLIDIASRDIQDLPLDQIDLASVRLSADSAGKMISMVSGAVGVLYNVDQAVAKTITMPSVTNLQIVGWVPVGKILPDQGKFGIPPSTSRIYLASGPTFDLAPAASEDVLVKDGYVYRISDGERSLEVMALSPRDGGDPRLLTSLLAADFDREVEAVISGNQIIAVGGLLQAIDISDPGNPVVTFSQNIGADKVAISEGKAFVSVGGNVLAYDIFGKSPQLLGELSLPGGDVLSIAAMGNYLVLAMGDGGVIGIDISDPAAMALAWSDTPGFAHEVGMNNSHAFVLVGSPGSQGELRIYNSVTGSQAEGLSPAPAQGEIGVRGRYLYATYPELAVFDVNGLENIVRVEEVIGSAAISQAGKVDVSSEYVVALSGGLVQVFFISNN